MKSLFTVISFTIKDMVKRKSFIISNIIILLIIIVGFNVPKLLKGIDTAKQKLLILDNSNIFEGKLEDIKTAMEGTNYEIEVDTSSTKEQIEERIKNKEISSA